MSRIEGKQTFNITYQPQQQKPRAQDQRIILIQNVKKYPRLYKNEFLRTPFLHRQEKQQMWDRIAQKSGFEKTEDAKCKWRSLINYLRQHLDSVAQKKLRRYIPVTENPEDKYVQLTDWLFYEDLEFVVPYVKYAATRLGNSGANHMEISPSEIDLILEGIEAEVEKKNEQQGKEKPKKETKLRTDKEQRNNAVFGNNDVDMTDDIILKEYFENMLKSTLKLPRFHQNHIRHKLLDCVNKEKDLNKIN